MKTGLNWTGGRAALIKSDLLPDDLEEGQSYDTELEFISQDQNDGECELIWITQNDGGLPDCVALTKSEAQALVSYLNSVIPTMKD